MRQRFEQQMSLCTKAIHDIKIPLKSRDELPAVVKAIPPSKISALSSGKFVDMVADDPDCKIELKAFHCEIINDNEALKQEQDHYKDIPIIRKLDNAMVQRNYL